MKAVVRKFTEVFLLTWREINDYEFLFDAILRNSRKLKIKRTQS